MQEDFTSLFARVQEFLLANVSKEEAGLWNLPEREQLIRPQWVPNSPATIHLFPVLCSLFPVPCY